MKETGRNKDPTTRWAGLNHRGRVSAGPGRLLPVEAFYWEDVFLWREREHLYNVRTHLEKTQNSFLKAQTLKDVFYIRSRGCFTEKELVSRKKLFLESLEIFKRRYDV